jgi:mono/diheme cytochrome c family protein
MMAMRHAVLVVLAALLLDISATGSRANPAQDQTQRPANDVPSGTSIYGQLCASCHGDDARGHGLAAVRLKTPPADLTTLAKRHGGKFPYDYVLTVLLVGTKVPAHGSPDMPVWFPIFKVIDNNNKQVVLQRIKNLSDYLASLQAK